MENVWVAYRTRLKNETEYGFMTGTQRTERSGESPKKIPCKRDFIGIREKEEGSRVDLD